VRYHRGFIDNKQGIAVFIFCQNEIHVGRGGYLFTVYLFMDGEGTFSGIGSNYLGGTTRGGQQDSAHSDKRKYFHECADQGCFSGTCVSFQDKSGEVVFGTYKIGEQFKCTGLILSWMIWKIAG